MTEVEVGRLIECADCNSIVLTHGEESHAAMHHREQVVSDTAHYMNRGGINFQPTLSVGWSPRRVARVTSRKRAARSKQNG